MTPIACVPIFNPPGLFGLDYWLTVPLVGIALTIPLWLIEIRRLWKSRNSGA